MERELEAMPGWLAVFDLHDLTAGIVTAIGAHVVRQMFVAAIGAIDQMPWPERVMSTSPIASTF